MRRFFHTWIESLLLEHRPWGLRWVSTWYGQRYLERTLIPQFLAAQAAGTGIFEAWVEPGTTHAEGGRWFEECIATAKATQDDYGMIRVVVAQCSEAEWEARGADLTQRLVVHWYGMARQRIRPGSPPGATV